MNRLKRAVPAVILSFIIYIVFTGSISVYDVYTGIIVAAVIGLLTGVFIVENPSKALSVKRALYMLKYIIWYFLVAETKAHFDVIKRALSPRPSLNPGIIRIPYNVSTDYAMTLIANSITNTPGTVVVDVDYDKKLFYVHWIDAKTQDPNEAWRMISSEFENYARKIFD